MSLDNPRSGPGLVSEYQVSALPYVTASLATSGTVTRIDFPYVTSFLSVKNSSPSGTLVVGFTYSGTLGSNYFTLSPGNSFGANFRVKTIYLTAQSGTVSYETVSGLTLIDTKYFPVLTGSTQPAPTGSFSYNGLG